MTRAGKKFKPDRGYTREDWDAVDSPPLTPEQLAQAKPFAEMFPELAETMRRNVGDRLVSENPSEPGGTPGTQRLPGRGSAGSDTSQESILRRA